MFVKSFAFMLMLMNLSTIVGLQSVISEPILVAVSRMPLHETQQHGKESKHADAD
jgi:hypothetical protein